MSLLVIDSFLVAMLIKFFQCRCHNKKIDKSGATYIMVHDKRGLKFHLLSGKHHLSVMFYLASHLWTGQKE
jgi:hypothetical protein